MRYQRYKGMESGSESAMSNVRKLQPKKESEILRRFEADYRSFAYEQPGIEYTDMGFINNFAKTMQYAASIDVNWLVEYTQEIYGQEAPVQMMFDRYKNRLEDFTLVLGFRHWKTMLKKHGFK